MSMIFKFRMLSDENDWFVREYEVPCDMKLVDLNDLICGDMRFDKDGVTSFFTSNGLWDREREFTCIDMSARDASRVNDDTKDHETPVPMDEVLLNQVIHRNRDRLIFLFDMFDDRCLYLELTEIKKRTGDVKYPRVALSKGDAPKQYGGGSDGRAIFDDMMDDFDDFESYETDGFADDF